LPAAFNSSPVLPLPPVVSFFAGDGLDGSLEGLVESVRNAEHRRDFCCSKDRGFVIEKPTIASSMVMAFPMLMVGLYRSIQRDTRIHLRPRLYHILFGILEHQLLDNSSTRCIPNIHAKRANDFDGRKIQLDVLPFIIWIHRI